MSDSASSPAPLDVPRLAAKDVTTLLAMLAEHEDYAVCAAPHDPIPSGRLSHLRKAALYRALRAALPALVEAGALLDRMETHVRGNPSQEIAFGMVGEDEGDVWATLTYGECSAHSEYDPSLRKALTNLLGYTAAAPALREGGDHG